MYTPGSRIHQDLRSCANSSAGSEKTPVYRARFLINAGQDHFWQSPTAGRRRYPSPRPRRPFDP
eukprot:5781453-Pyramimonas_sp.AAC.1